MAAAAPSPLVSSAEKTNGAKLSRLLIDGGTTVLRNVFDSYHPPANLAANLNANYKTLNKLVMRRVLRPAQWDLLFPPGGATPDSKTFDITLLFLLLTNICGLCSPLSGWHSKPPPTDFSFEANLARIKFFRNELYGHVTTTEVDTPTFYSLWQEISAVLIALGLNQAEIDRLKAEHCGEEDYLDVLRDWADSEEDIKSQLKDIRQYQIETRQNVERLLQTHMQEGVERIRQSQLQDRETLQDSKAKLEDIHVIQRKTQETVEGVAKIQEEGFKSVKADLQQIKQSVDSLKEERNRKSPADEALCTLAKSEFKGDIEYHVGRFQEGTREWVFNKVEKWLDDRTSQNRVMVISANAGMGKSVISAVICKKMQEAGRLSGSHFCQYNNARYRNPQLMLQSLASHLCHALPEYKQVLVKQLSRNLGKDLNNMGVEELFALLFKEPLSTVVDPGRNLLMVLDGLDESEYQERNELLDVISNHFCKLPCWIRFLCTTRPERNIAEALKQLKPFQVEPSEKENVQDIKLFLEKKTQHLIKPENKGVVVEKLLEKSEGLMLHAYFLVSFIEENVSVLDQGDLDGSLPLAISSVYHSYFKRLENELKELGVKEENFLNLLCAVTASRKPLPIDYVSRILVPGANSPIARRKALKAIGSVSSLLPIRDGCLHVIHKSINDWLIDTSCYGEHDFSLDEKEGHRILASLCSDELDNLKQKGVYDTQLSSTEKYALQHGVRHMIQLGEVVRSQSLDECVQAYVIDLELLYAKLCLIDSLAAEDILWLQRQDIPQGLSENNEGLLNTIMLLLRKHNITFTNYPHVFFQTVLNEGGSVLSSVASSLLQNKYPKIPYMEFVHKEAQQGFFLARFQCSSPVACFDVSPRLDYMVCECKEGTIYFWSLHTSKLLWTRPVMETKLYSLFVSRRLLAFPAVSSVYRSVVFHPTADFVLPGVLSHAYTFDGDLKPLFPESNCRFTVCSISGDKTKMLTDCPDDAKCIIMWSLKNGLEITHTTRNEDVLSFAWTRDEKLLAISHSTGSICIVDAMDSFRTLAETVVPEICGEMKFSSDCQSLFCDQNKDSRLKLNMAEIPSITLCEVESVMARDLLSHGESGFLLGDATYNGYSTFLLNKQTVLMSDPHKCLIEMINCDKVLQATDTRIGDIVFSLSGETVYVVSEPDSIISAWDLLRERIAGQMPIKSNQNYDRHNLVALKEGVLSATQSGALELWNLDLSKCVRSWTNINGITRMIPISGERVACETEKKVIILDTTSGEIVLTIPIDVGWLLACNSKCQLLTYNLRSIQLSDGKTILWTKEGTLSDSYWICSLFEQFVVISLSGEDIERSYIFVLDALSGKSLHVLRVVIRAFDCKFVSDEECVISLEDALLGYCLQLFNVKSGDLLSVIDLERKVRYLAAYPCNSLLAIQKFDSTHGFKLIQVQLPQVKDSRKSKWALNTGDHEKVQVREGQINALVLIGQKRPMDLCTEGVGWNGRSD